VTGATDGSMPVGSGRFRDRSQDSFWVLGHLFRLSFRSDRSRGEAPIPTEMISLWMEAEKLLADYWPAVQALATKLLKRRTLDGRDAHHIIWQTIGYPDTDWGLEALNIQKECAR
jgi:hypothetical protein